MKNWDSGKLSIAFSCVGHTYIHLFTAFYFTIILALEDAWQLSYADLLDLWLPASLLVGLIALPAGWLGDRWSLSGMMAIFFIGLGVSSVAAGFVGGPLGLMIALAGIGAFAAIYHPIAIPWVIRSAQTRVVGTTLALNGIFGGLGIGVAALVAGALIDLFNWRVAFILPGVICAATGLWMLRFILAGRIVEPPARQPGNGGKTGNEAALRGFLILLATMFLAGLIFHVTQTATPKLFDLRIRDWVGESTTGVGVIVFVVYGVAAFAQFIGGWASDRWSLKLVYLQAWILQVPLLLLAAILGGPVLVLATLLLASANTASLPAENLLLARYTPPERHGVIFGVKFILAFGAAPLGIKLVGWLQTVTGEFVLLYTLMGAAAALVVGLALFLPPVSVMPRPAPAPAE